MIVYTITLSDMIAVGFLFLILFVGIVVALETEYRAWKRRRRDRENMR